MGIWVAAGQLIAGLSLAQDRSEDGGSLAGRVVDRFAPPVAAPIDTLSPGLPRVQTAGSLLRPCDTPGSGCQNPLPNTTQVVVPPILPGTRPPHTNP